MIRLNPKSDSEKKITLNLCAPGDELMSRCKDDSWKISYKPTPLTTTYEGMKTVANHYGIGDKWNQYLSNNT